LEGEITGTPVKRFDEDIKAITYEDLDIEKIKGVWRTDLVLDV
jgi:SHS2 domain-containing protein